MRFLVVFALAAATCEPTPAPPPEPEDHCPESCRQLQELGCKRGSDGVCAEFDDETGECAATKTCVEACHDDPHAYPRGAVEACP